MRQKFRGQPEHATEGESGIFHIFIPDTAATRGSFKKTSFWSAAASGALAECDAAVHTSITSREG
jgi:hypothetical protein